MISLQEVEKEQSNKRRRERQGTERAHLSEPQKVHPTSEFIVLL